MRNVHVSLIKFGGKPFSFHVRARITSTHLPCIFSAVNVKGVKCSSHRSIRQELTVSYFFWLTTWSNESLAYYSCFLANRVKSNVKSTVHYSPQNKLYVLYAQVKVKEGPNMNI